MQSIKVENPFKGLLTNGNDREINFSYFADMDKVKVSKKYLQSEEYRIEEIFGSLGENFNVIEIKQLNLETSDKFYYRDGVNQYNPDLSSHLVVIAEDTVENNQVVLVYTYFFNSGFTYLPLENDRITNYKKMYEVQGTLRILTEDGLYILQWKQVKRLGDYRRTLVLEKINSNLRKNNLILSSTSGTVETTGFRIQILITPVNLVYECKSLLTNMEEFRVTRARNNDGDIFTPSVPFYYGTGYIVSYYQPPYAFSNKGLYDYDSTETFLFVPKEKVGTSIKYGIANLSFTALNEKYYPGTLNAPESFTAIVDNQDFGYHDRNYPHVFTPNVDLWSNVFLDNVLSTVAKPDTSNSYIDGSEFQIWATNENNIITYQVVKAVSNALFGFDTTTNPDQRYATVIQTVVFDGTNETMVGYKDYVDNTNGSRTIYSITPITNLPLLSTSTKLYIGFGTNPTNYELVKIWNIAKQEFPSTVYIGYPDLTGILLSNILAVYGLLDEFEYVNGGDDYVLINSVGFLIKGGTVYYSPNDVSNAVFYKNRYIPNVYGDALISIGGMLGVIRYNKDVTLISIQVIENEIYFKVYDTVSFVIKDRDSFLEIPDGVLMSLRDGLYLSTPQERQLLSEPINDIFEEGKVTKLLYDDYNRRIMVQSLDSIYVFDLINKVWLKFKNLQLRNIAFDGENVITIDGSSFAKVILSNDTEGRVTFHKVSLGNNKLLKRLIGLRIDLDGTLTTFTDSYGHSGSLMQSNEQLGRRIEEFYIHLNNQSPTVGLDFTIGFKGKIYSIEILYEVIGEFVSTYDKIYYPPIEETIVVQNNTPVPPNPPPTEDFITNIANKTLWFKPENISSAVWTDEISGREWQTDTGVDIPTVALNGYDVFYSSARALCNTLSSTYTVIGTDNSWTLMGVFKLVSGNAIFNYLSNSVTGVMTLNTNAGASRMYLRDTGSDELLIASIDDQNVWGCMIITYDNTTKTLRFRLDDIDESSTNLNYNQVAVNLQWGYKFWMNGSTTSTGIVTPGNIGENGIAEFFIATGIKTDSELANARNWLKFKYGV